MTGHRQHYGGADKPHHLWCNFSQKTGAPCTMCDGLYQKYPYEEPGDDDAASGQLFARHFPTASKRS